MGIFIKDYESAGPGIAKNAPKKKGIRLFFELLFRKFWLLAEVNMLYSVFFLPILLILAAISFIDNTDITMIVIAVLALVFMVTIGPATAGMFKIMRSYVLEKHSFIVHDFFKAFRTNFKQAAVIGFFDCVITLSAFAAFRVYPLLAEKYGSLMYVCMIITFSFALVVLMMNYYIYLMLIATNLSMKNLIKNSFALAFVSLKTNCITFAATIVTFAALLPVYIYFRPIFMVLILFFPAAFLCFVCTFNSYPVIQKYVINPYYTSIGQVNPELMTEEAEDEEVIFEDMGGKEKPIEKRKKGKGKRIS